MYCNSCGGELAVDARFCQHCGGAVPHAAGVAAASVRPRLERPREGRRIAGVCAAVARYLDVDPVLVRLLWVIACFIGGGGLIAYFLGWIIIPEEPLALPQAVRPEQSHMGV